MRNFQRRRKVINLLRSVPVLAFLFILILFFSYNMLDLVGKMRETAKNKKIVEDKIAELEASKVKLDLDIGKLNSDQGLEESIREKFGLVKEGEKMIVIVDEKKEIEIPMEANTGGFFSFFRNLFK